MAAYEVLVTLKLDSGDKLFSVSGLQGASGFYRDRLLELSPVEQALSLVPDEFRQSEVTVTLNDSDQHLSMLRATENFYNRTLEVRLGDSTQGVQSFTTVFSGSIVGWSKSGTTFSVSAASAFHRIFERTVTPGATINRRSFPKAPAESLSRLIPLLAGTLDSSTWQGKGALEPIPVDESTGLHVVAQGPLTDGTHNMAVLRVYVESENEDGDLALMLQPESAWSQTVDLYSGLRCLTIQFNDPAAVAGRRVTCDVGGLQGYSQPSSDSAQTSVMASDNPLANLRRFLGQQGSLGNRITDDSFDAASSYATEAQLNALAVRGPVWCVERERLVRDVIDDFARSTNVTLFIAKDGKIASTIPRPGITSDSAVSIGPDRVIGDSLELRSPDRVASTLDYSFRYSPASGQFEGTSSYESPGQVTALGRNIRTDVQFPFVYEEESAGEVALVRAFFMREQRIACSLTADAKLYLDLSVGDDLKLSHYAGLGSVGFSDRLFRVIGLSLQVDNREITTGLRLVDVSEAVAPPRTDYGRDERRDPGKYRGDGQSR